MSYRLVILVLCMTTFLSSLFSPARGDDGLPIYSFEAWYGTDSGPAGSAPRDGVIEVPLSNVEIQRVCITDPFTDPPQDCSTNTSSLPKDTQLRSTNKVVASVSEGTNPVIQLNSPGATI